MVIELMIVISPGHFVVAPDAFLNAGEDNSDVGIRWLGVGPDVVISIAGLLLLVLLLVLLLLVLLLALLLARRLEPRVLIRGVVDDEICDHPDAALASLARELDEIAQVSQTRVDTVVA